jgi:hypothetical protein
LIFRAKTYTELVDVCEITDTLRLCPTGLTKQQKRPTDKRSAIPIPSSIAMGSMQNTEKLMAATTDVSRAHLATIASVIAAANLVWSDHPFLSFLSSLKVKILSRTKLQTHPRKEMIPAKIQSDVEWNRND